LSDEAGKKRAAGLRLTDPVARGVETEVDGVIGAFIHGQPLPDAPAVRKADEAIDEHWKRLDDVLPGRAQGLARESSSLAPEVRPKSGRHAHWPFARNAS
jgi:hypothetical protein